MVAPPATSPAKPTRSVPLLGPLLFLLLTPSVFAASSPLNDRREGPLPRPYARLMFAVGELRDGQIQEGKAILIGLSQEFPQNAQYQRQIARLH